MSNGKYLAEILWKPFIRQIQTGGPVYFCFNREMLFELFMELETNIENPVAAINSAAKEFLILDNIDVEVKSDVFKKNSNGLSSAIVLICQQVLVVEEMVRDPEGFSEQAYFPRLRKNISSELKELSLNPFSFEDFEEIWRKFAADVLSLRGAGKSTITFQFGIERGINKARSFPMSQALLSKDDLLLLVQRVGLRNSQRLDRELLWSAIRHGKSVLRRRGQRLLAHGFLKDRIIDQVRSFAISVDESMLVSPPLLNEIGNYNLCAFKEQVDWQNDEYRFFLSATSDGQRDFDENRIASLMDEVLRRKGFLILPCDSIGDTWIKRKQYDSIFPGETFIILGSPTEIKRAFGILQSIYPDFSGEIVAEYNIGDRPNEKLREVVWPKTISKKILIFDGALSQQKSQSGAQTYEWIGGICVDQRTNRYLSNYLPQAIRFSEKTFAFTDLLRINGGNIASDMFILNIHKFATNTSLVIEFPNGLRAQLSLAALRTNEPDWMGMQILENRVLSPVLDRVNVGTEAIIGYSLPKLSQRPLSPIQVAVLLSEVSTTDGIELGNVALKDAIKRVELSSAPFEVKSVLLRKLRDRPRFSNKGLEQLDISE